MPGLVLLCFLGVAPCAAQDGNAEPSTAVSGAEAVETVAEAMRNRGLVPPADSDLALTDFISTDVTFVEGRQQSATRHVRLRIGPNGEVLPGGDWLDANSCYIEEPELRRATNYVNFKLFRYGDVHDVAIQFLDVETGRIQNQRMGEGGEGKAGLVETIGDAWNQLQVPIGPLVDPCEEREVEMATCTFEADVSGAISGRFEGQATVSFDGEGSRTQVTDLELIADGFELKAGLQPSLDVGGRATLQGIMGSAGQSAGQEGAFEIFALQEEYDDFINVEVRESWTISWNDLPETLREFTLSMFGGMDVDGAAAMDEMPPDSDAYEQQVGDVAVLGVIEGQLTRNGGPLLEALGRQPDHITFRAEFDAGGDIFECDPEGFPERMEQQWEQLRQEMQQLQNNP